MSIATSPKAIARTIAVVWLLICSCVSAQTLNYPSKPELTELTSSKYKIAISFPSTWTLDTPLRNEVWLSTGTLRDRQGLCFVRVSTVQHLGLSKPESFFSQIDRAKFTDLTSISMPDVNVRVYDLAYLGGRKARRAIYTGTDSGIKTASTTYQALDGDNLITVGCVSQASDFAVLMNDFEAVISSFRFIK